MKLLKNLSFSLLMVASYLSIGQETNKEISREWVSFSQFIEITTDKELKFKLVGSLKIEDSNEHTFGGLWARVDNRGEEMGFFDNMQNSPEKVSDIWADYEIIGTIDENSKTLNFGGLCLYNGKFYFDNIRLYIEDETGEYQPVNIENNSFESKVKGYNIPKWSLGISKGKIVKVKEFEITQSKDSSLGSNSLLIMGSNIPDPEPFVPSTIGDAESKSPQIESMISMLEDLKDRVEYTVKDLTPYELDHLHDENANRIGALIMHLAAAEKFYQVFTFEGREFNDQEKEIWEDALNLDKKGRDKFQGHSIQYYLDIYNEIRAVTIAELRKRDDTWFEEIQPAYGWSNHYCWFHVMEHQSSHLGQILFLKKRIPPEPVIEVPDMIKQ